MRKQKGISMVSLVITIIILLILLGITFSYSNNSIKQAGRGVFVRELSLVQQAANEKKIDNQIDGSSEEIKFKGFYKTKIKNPPISFESFSEDEIYGYVIDLEYVHAEDADRGHDYKRFAEDIESNVVEFGKDDVYVCDREGNVFYAKGYQTDEGTYYSKDELEGLGPEFVSIDKIISSDSKSATIRVVVKRSNSGDLSLKIDNEEATKVGTSEDGTMDTFEKKVFENKTYKLTATEEKDGTIGKTTSSVEVTELDVITYVIQYDANGGTDAPSSHLKTENIITRLSTKIPKRDGYTFLGWNENPSATIATYKPGSEYVFDKDVIFFAIWKEGKERTYNVTYNANGGSNGPLSQENLTGEYTISTITPDRDGYGFLGWSEDSRATATTYMPGETITLTKNLSLYAVWSKGTYTVTLSTNPEGAGTLTGNVAKPDGVETYISTTANAGYIFKNWTVKSGSINLQNSSSATTSFIMPKENVEIVANYEVGDLTVKYNANKGKGAPLDESAKYGDAIVISPKIPTRTGYDFVGWSLKPSATEGTYFAGQTYTVKENVTFYAIWKENIPTYTLTFNLNGGYGNTAGEVGKFGPMTKVKGGVITIPVGGTNEPYKKDYVFKGWALNPDSEEVVLKPGDTYSKDANMEIYAVWKDEMPPTLVLTPKQEEGSEEVKIIATAYDEGKLAGYAWTTTNVEPTIWETESIKDTDLTVEKIIKEKGEHYFWVKDTAGNITTESIKAYEIKYDANGGTNAPKTQYQLENTELKLSTQKPKMDKYTFLGWSTAVTPGNTESDVNFKSGATLNLNADITLKAVWGEAGFKLSSKNVTTQIDGPSVTVTVTKGSYTGNITVTSTDTEKATATIKDNVITIKPGTKIGDVEITVTEDREGTTEKILVIVNRGIRKLTLDKTETSFEYGDSNEKIGFTYTGKETTMTTQTSNSEIATATVSDKTLTIKPKNCGSATITLVLEQDDQYLEQTADVQVTITNKKIIVTPESNQSKVYDGTALTPTLTYTYKGNKGSETPKFTGELTREIGSDIGEYEIKIGTLALANNGDFKASNYTLELSTTKVYFTITPKRIAVPSAITPQEYDGTTKYGVAEGEDYVRGGEYQKVNAGNYIATVALKDTKNYVWDDTSTTTAKNIKWEITKYNLTNTDIVVEPIENKVYTGNEITPIPVVKRGEKTLENGNDYTLTYANNINAGTATITITGKGNYAGTITTTFEIVATTMQVDAAGYTGAFDNANHTIKVNPIWPSTGYTIYYSTTKLTKENYATTGTTTNPAYKNVGTTTVYYYIVAQNFEDYSGSEIVKITAKDLSGNITITGVVDKTYTGNEITQSITVKDNEQSRTLEEGKEYKVTYENNIKVGTATLTVTGIDNYAGTVTTTFKILGDTITIAKSTEAVVEKLEITITRTLTPGKLQYKIDNGEWKDYTGPFEITKDCTIYARSIDGENIIGTNELKITNICEHEYTEATCTEDSVCKYCGKLNKEKLGHDFTSKTIESTYLAKAATCTTKATYYYKCSRCTAKGTETYEYGEALGHEFTSKTATATYLCTPATCTTKATYYYKCIRCDAKGTETYEYGEANGHDFTSKTQTQEYWKSDATCTEAATYYYKCTKCDAKGTATYTVGSPLGHDFTEKIINDTYICTSATCTKPATYYYKCSRCNEKSTETYEYGDPLGHSYGEYVEKQAATCVTEGIEEATCIRCGITATRTTATNPENHEGTIQEIEITAATCTTTGRKKYVCSACNGIIRYETIAALGHDWDAEEPPRECRRCGLREEYVAQAIYCESDGSLTFVKSLTEYQAGDTYDGKTVTAVYTGFENTTYLWNKNAPWYDNRENIKSVVVKDTISPTSTAYWFYEFKNCSTFDLENLDVSNVTNMEWMFSSAGHNTTTFDVGDLSGWNVSKVTNMDNMFSSAGYSATTFNIGDLSNWNVSNVTDMFGMFSVAGYSATTFNIGDLSNWNVSNVTYMMAMFSHAGYTATTFNIGDLSNWDVSNVTDMSMMFFSAGHNTTTFDVGDLSGWNVSNVTDMSYMFCDAGLGATAWNVGDLSSWNVSNVTDMSYMFCDAGLGATAWNVGDLSSWDVSKVTDMEYMFYKASYSATIFNIGDLSNWNVSKVTDMEGMFSSAGYSATTWSIGDLSNWDVSNVIDMRGIFHFAGFRATTWNIGDLSGWDVSKVTDMAHMFTNAGPSATTFNIGDIGKWNVSNVESMYAMFHVAGACATTWSIGDLSNWNVSNVTDMHSMFYGVGGNMTELNIGDLGSWNTSKVTDMSDIFRECRNLKKLNLTGWDTSNVTEMSYMFDGCVNLQEVTLGEKFSFVGTDGYLPVPSGTYITDATGLWYNKATKVGYAPEDIPNKTAATYVAYPVKTAQAIYCSSDGSLTFVNSTTLYSAGGKYNSKTITAVYTGFEDEEYSWNNNVPWYSYRESIKSVTVKDTITPKSTAYWFEEFKKCSTFTVTNLDVSKVKNMTSMFSNAGLKSTSYKITGMNNWDVSNVTDMSYMFAYSQSWSADGGPQWTSFNIGDLSKWNTSKVTDMSNMFTAFGSKVKTLNLSTIKFSSWDVSNVTDMTSMFYSTGYNSTSFTLDISGWDTSNVTDMTMMFDETAYSATTINITGLNTLNTSKVTSMTAMFNKFGYKIKSLTIGDLSDWDVSNVTSMYNMFASAGYTATTFKIVGLDNWDVSKVETMAGMFQLAGYSATTWDIGNLTEWDVSKVTKFGDLLNDLVIDGDTITYTGTGMFAFAGYNATTWDVGDLSSWDVSNADDMAGMFCSAANKATTFDIGDLSKWNTAKVTDMRAMFATAGKNATTWNIGDLGAWKTSNVTNLSYMFWGCEKIKELNLSGWDTSKVTSMSNMFTGCYNLQEVTLGKNFKFVGTDGYLPVPSNTYITDANGLWYNKATGIGYAPSAIPNNTAATYTAVAPKVIRAIYCESDGSLTFINQSTLYSVGDTYNGKTITAIYAGFENVEYAWNRKAPWYENRENIKSVVIKDTIAPTSTAYWFEEFKNCSTFDVTNLDVSNVTNMQDMFWDSAVNCTSYTITGMNNWDVSNVTNMSHLFGYTPVWVDGGPQWTKFTFGSLSKWNTSKVTDMAYMFSAFGSKLSTFDISSIGFSSWDVSNVTDMSGIFNSAGYYSTTFKLDISSWKTSSVTDMSFMFDDAAYSATSMTLKGINTLDTSKVTDMANMFGHFGYKIKTWNIGDLSDWDVSNVISMRQMFMRAGYNATTFKLVGLDNWNVSKVTDMHSIFWETGYSGTTWSIGDLSNWNVSSVTDMEFMFYFAGATVKTFNIGNLDNWNVSSVTNMSYMFQSAGYKATTWNIGDITKWQVSNVTDMSYMFQSAGYSATAFDIGDLGAWRTSKVTDMSYMFNNCKNLKELNLSGWDTSNVTTMEGMFDGCVNLQEVSLGKNFKFVGTNGYLPTPSSTYITDADGLWYNVATEIGYTPENIPNNTAATYRAIPPNRAQAIYCASDGSLTFINQPKIYSAGEKYNNKTITAVYTGFDTDVYWSYGELPWYDYVEAIKSVVVSDEIQPISTARWFQGMENCKKFDLTNLNTSQVKYMHNMFQYAAYQSTSITLTGLDTWDTSNVTTMYDMFYYFGKKVKTLNLDLSNWDTSNITDMECMFYGVGYSSTTLTITLSNWDVSNVKYMKKMFSCAGEEATTVKILGLTNWDVSNVEDMNWMFKQTGEFATTFKIESLTNWKTSKVVDMEDMFGDAGMSATTWSIGDLSNWDVSNVENMHWLFSFAGRSCTSWSIGDLSGWDVSNVTNMTRMFQNAGESAKSWSIGDLSNWDVSNVESMDGMFEYAGYSSTTFKLVGLDSWKVSNVTDMSTMFDNTGYKATTWSIGDLSNWNVSNVTDMSGMFSEAGYTATNWSIGDLSKWNVSNVISFGYAWDEPEVSGSTISFYGVGMFLNAGANAKTFNLGDLSGWNVSNAKAMAGMFFGAGSSATTFKIGDISSWNTSKVTDMRAMFACTGNNASYKLNLSGWNVSNVEYSTYFNWSSTSKVTSPF